MILQFVADFLQNISINECAQNNHTNLDKLMGETILITQLIDEKTDKQTDSL